MLASITCNVNIYMVYKFNSKVAYNLGTNSFHLI
jgi:hypothetical protein